MMTISKIKAIPVPVTLDKERTLLYDLNAFAELEMKTGENLQQTLEKVSTGSFKAMRTLLWAGLIHEDKDLQEKDVGAMIGLHNITEVIGAISEALGVSLPEAGDLPGVAAGEQ